MENKNLNPNSSKVIVGVLIGNPSCGDSCYSKQVPEIQIKKADGSRPTNVVPSYPP